MGAIHDGHLSLVREGRRHADISVASIFVNPTQFAPHEDFAAYPRNETRDLDLLASAGCDLVYCPEASEIYPPGDITRVTLPAMSALLEGRARPHFFEGVATVVSRLFIHLRPDVAVFGEKDFQQVQIIRRMTLDFGFPVEIVTAPTLREADGLAMSSRNAYLTEADRSIAPHLHRTLSAAAEALSGGARVGDVIAGAVKTLATCGFNRVDYVSACDPATLVEFTDDTAPRTGRLLAAAVVGRTRLIDNIPF